MRCQTDYLAALLLIPVAATGCGDDEPGSGTAPPAPRVGAEAPDLAATEAEQGPPALGAAVATDDWASFGDDGLGLSVQYPDGWSELVTESFVNVGTNDEVVGGAPLEEGDARVIFLVTDTGRLGEGTPADVLQAKIEDQWESPTIVDGPEPVTINGKPAAMATVALPSSPPRVLRGAVVRAGERSALVLAMSTADDAGRYAPTFETIASTIELSAVE